MVWKIRENISNTVFGEGSEKLQFCYIIQKIPQKIQAAL